MIFQWRPNFISGFSTRDPRIRIMNSADTFRARSCENLAKATRSAKPALSTITRYVRGKKLERKRSYLQRVGNYSLCITVKPAVSHIRTGHKVGRCRRVVGGKSVSKMGKRKYGVVAIEHHIPNVKSLSG